MSSSEINAGFNKWNPMETDYMSTEFNKYISGPGANLHEELQPARQASQKGAGKNAVPTLVFKHVPKEMTKRALYNICSRHGMVREVRDSTKNSFYFVDMATVGDMEAALRGLENNSYGFKILVGKEKESKPLDMGANQLERNYPAVPPKSTGIDFENRKYRTSKKNHQRPNVKEENPFKVSTVNITGLPMNLLLNDAHTLERQGLSKLLNNDKFSYRNGRSYINMPEKTKQFVDKKHKESSGKYDENEDKFVHNGEDSRTPNNISKCFKCNTTCDTVCERCSQYYCSIECQKNDWPEHRYKCGKPLHLQKTPPSKKNMQAGNELTEQKKQTGVDENFKEITDKPSPKELKKPEAFRERLLSANKMQTQDDSTSSILSLQVDKAQNISVQQVENPSKITAKSSSKRLPAALRISAPQYSSTEAKSQSEPQSISLKSLPKASPKSSSTAENNPGCSVDNSIETYKQNMPRSGNIVTMTAIIKTNVVFIRSTTYEADLSYINTVDTLQTLGRRLCPLKTLPKSGDVVIAKVKEQFNRALVLTAVNPETILIHFMDYGNIEQAKFDDLLEAPQEFKFKPRHAIPVVLKDVRDVYMTQEIRKFMHAYLNNINLEIRYKPEDFLDDNNIYAVELIDETTQQSLNKIIAKLSKAMEPQDNDELCDRNYLERKILPGGRNVELIVMDNSLMCSGCISCTTNPYAREIEKFIKDIQAYVESIPEESYTPRVDELCIAKYDEDGLWYRGICLETVGDGHPSIHFFDYGNITIVPIEYIRRYPRQFTYPIYTADCAIDGLPEFCDDKLVEELEELIPNGEQIKCENVIVDEESNFYILSMPNVIRVLRERGLLDI